MNDEKKLIPPHELQSIKMTLVERKKELEEQLSSLYREPMPDDTQDIGDQALSSTMETLRISLQDAELEEYNMIVRALTMIENGTYGICVECNQAISDKRLRRYPNATRCLICQEHLEERKKEL